MHNYKKAMGECWSGAAQTDKKCITRPHKEKNV